MLQRQGRAGRVRPGVCFRLFSADEFGQLDEFTPAALLRSPLEATALQLLALGAPGVTASYLASAAQIEIKALKLVMLGPEDNPEMKTMGADTNSLVSFASACACGPLL